MDHLAAKRRWTGLDSSSLSPVDSISGEYFKRREEGEKELGGMRRMEARCRQMIGWLFLSVWQAGEEFCKVLYLKTRRTIRQTCREGNRKEER